MKGLILQSYNQLDIVSRRCISRGMNVQLLIEHRRVHPSTVWPPRATLKAGHLGDRISPQLGFASPDPVPQGTSFRVL